MFSISIHAPLAGCDLTPPPPDGGITISIHAPLAGCDAGHGRSKHRRGDFNPRTPCGVRHLYTSCMRWPRIFQSTHPLRGATAGSAARDGPDGEISIHAPLAGCDGTCIAHSSDCPTNFNPRTPCGVRRSSRSISHWASWISIHAPLAGCDIQAGLLRLPAQISIHAPLAGCDLMAIYRSAACAISIHAPLAGCDCRSRPCLRRPRPISIHAPLAGCDSAIRQGAHPARYFNPRTPCGVRQQKRTKKTALFLN